jgi:outer membrane lipoprotein-sorting protein
VKQFYSRLTVCALLLVSVASVWAQRPQPFSADIAISAPKGENMNGKIYMNLPRSRWDMTSHGQNVSMITDGSTQTSYMIMHQQRMYMEIHGNQSNPMTQRMPKVDTNFDPQNPCGKDVTCKKVGTETINGRVCDKWVTTQKDGKTSTAWVDQKLFFPIKTVSDDGRTMELNNIKEGASPASTFVVPDGYRKMDMGNMMGGRPQN